MRTLRKFDSQKASYAIHEGKFWTSKQRQMHPIHYSISYRASFKPEIPDFFIRKYIHSKHQVIFDPFAGRGTTIIQANMLGYKAIHNDLSPVSYFLSSKRKEIPSKKDFLDRIHKINFNKKRPEPTCEEKIRFYPFFHPDTFKEILNLRDEYLHNQEDKVLKYIYYIALTRLHGHTDGFFSVYSFPQISISPEAQMKNNQKHNIVPFYKDIKSRIIKKFEQDHRKELPSQYKISKFNEYYQMDSRNLKKIPNHYVDLIITSPPFLDKVDYKRDNWLKAWFLGVEKEMNEINLANYKNLKDWQEFMFKTLQELERVLKVKGKMVIEVGEVKNRKNIIYLEDVITEIIEEHFQNLEVIELYINKQNFTKISNCWNIFNNYKGTNSNRCLVIEKKYQI